MASSNAPWFQNDPLAVTELAMAKADPGVQFASEYVDADAILAPMSKSKFVPESTDGYSLVKASCPTHGTRDLSADQNYDRPHAMCNCKDYDRWGSPKTYYKPVCAKRAAG